jgi:hypothetical protein
MVSLAALAVVTNALAAAVSAVMLTTAEVGFDERRRPHRCMSCCSLYQGHGMLTIGVFYYNRSNGQRGCVSWMMAASMSEQPATEVVGCLPADVVTVHDTIL